MSFNLYFAGQQAKEVDQYIIKKKCCRLFSQSNERKGILEYCSLCRKSRPKLLVDSGAFSVAHSGKSVDIDQYIDFINENDDGVTAWVELDSIPFPVLNSTTAKKCSEESWQSYLYMLPKVKSPEKLIPIYHFGEPKENLRRILNTEHEILDGKPAPYIGVGGRHGVSTQEQLHYFDDVFKIIKSSKNPNVKIHAFGMTVLTLLEQFPFYSADSTTWLQLGINGNIITEHGIFVVSDRNKTSNNILNQHHECRKIVEEDISKFGYTLEEVSTDYKKRLMCNIDFFQNWADNYKYKPLSVRRRRLI